MYTNLKKLIENDPYIAIFLSSIVLSIIYLSSNQFINRDGIHYIETAMTVKSWRLAEFKSYDLWPYYSYTLKLLHTVLHLSVPTTAKLLNSLAIALLITILVFLSQHLTTISKQDLWIPASLFLIFPGLNEMRTEILREPIGLPFLIGSLYAFTHYEDKKKTRYLVYSLGLIILSILFRLEYLAYLFGVPSIFLTIKCFYNGPKQAAQNYKMLFYTAIALTILALTSYIGLILLQFKIEDIGRLKEIPLAWKHLYSAWNKHIINLNQCIFTQFGKHDTKYFLFFGVLGVHILKTLSNISVNIFLPIFASYFIYKTKVKKTNIFISSYKTSWLTYTVTALIIPFYLLSRNLFVPNRFYLTAIVLMLIPTAKYLTMISNKTFKNTFKAFSFLCIIIGISKSYHQTEKDKLILKTTEFIKQFNPSCLGSNNNQIAYYSNFNTKDKNFIRMFFEVSEKEIQLSSESIGQRLKQAKCQKTLIALKIKNKNNLSYLNKEFLSHFLLKHQDHKKNIFVIYQLTPLNQYCSGITKLVSERVCNSFAGDLSPTNV